MQLGCCGVDSYRDFKDTPIPYSCCKGAAEETTCSPQDASTKGCAQALQETFKYAGTVLGGIALGIAAVEVRVLEGRSRCGRGRNPSPIEKEDKIMRKSTEKRRDGCEKTHESCNPRDIHTRDFLIFFSWSASSSRFAWQIP